MFKKAYTISIISILSITTSMLAFYLSFKPKNDHYQVESLIHIEYKGNYTEINHPIDYKSINYKTNNKIATQAGDDPRIFITNRTIELFSDKNFLEKIFMEIDFDKQYAKKANIDDFIENFRAESGEVPNEIKFSFNSSNYKFAYYMLNEVTQKFVYDYYYKIELEFKRKGDKLLNYASNIKTKILRTNDELELLDKDAIGKSGFFDYQSKGIQPFQNDESELSQIRRELHNKEITYASIKNSIRYMEKLIIMLNRGEIPNKLMGKAAIANATLNAYNKKITYINEAIQFYTQRVGTDNVYVRKLYYNLNSFKNKRAKLLQGLITKIKKETAVLKNQERSLENIIANLKKQNGKALAQKKQKEKETTENANPILANTFNRPGYTKHQKLQASLNVNPYSTGNNPLPHSSPPNPYENDNHSEENSGNNLNTNPYTQNSKYPTNPNQQENYKQNANKPNSFFVNKINHEIDKMKNELKEIIPNLSKYQILKINKAKPTIFKQPEFFRLPYISLEKKRFQISIITGVILAITLSITYLSTKKATPA